MWYGIPGSGDVGLRGISATILERIGVGRSHSVPNLS